MKNYNKQITLALIVTIAILSFCLGITIYNGRTKDELHHFEGSIKEEKTSVRVDVFIARNKKGDLLNYSTDIDYSKELIVGAQLYYLKNDEKEVILGNSLDSYRYSKKEANNKEEDDDLNIMIENADKIYVDLCKDYDCNEIFKTVKLSYEELK